MTINDNPEVRYWAVEAANHGGRFLQKIAGAALSADVNNYPILKPALLKLMNEYRQYLCCESAPMGDVPISHHHKDCKLRETL